MNNFKDNLLYIKSQLKKYEKSTTIDDHLDRRLDKCFNLYVENLERTCRYLTSQNAIKILKYENRRTRRSKLDE